MTVRQHNALFASIFLVCLYVFCTLVFVFIGFTRPEFLEPDQNVLMFALAHSWVGFLFFLFLFAFAGLITRSLER